MSRAAQTAPPQEPAQHTYSLVCLAALAILLFTLLERGLGAWALLPVLVGAVGVLARWRLGPVLLLVPLVGLLFALAKATGPRPLSLADVVLCGSTLVCVAGQYRLQGLTKNVFPIDPRRRPPPEHRPVGAAVEAEPQKRPGRLVSPSEIIWLVVVVVLCAGAAPALWLGTAPARPHAVPWPDLGGNWGHPTRLVWGILQVLIWPFRFLVTAASNAMGLLWVLGVVWIAGTALLNWLGWRRLGAEEAAVYVQDMAWRETRREQRQLHDWLAWARLRKRPAKEAS